MRTRYYAYGQRGRRGRAEQAWLRAYRSDAASAQNGLCCYCTEPLTADTISADHSRPRSAGGRTTKKNVKAACKDCNFAKGSMAVPQFLKAIKHPEHGAPFMIWLAFMRRRIWLQTHRVCTRIERLTSPSPGQGGRDG